jgi:hypothetical protein
MQLFSVRKKRKMNYKIIVFAGILNLVSCQPDNKNCIVNDLSQNQLKSKVFSVEKVQYVAEEKFGQIEKGEKRSPGREIDYYSVEGFLDSTIFYHDKEGLTGKIIMRYSLNKDTVSRYWYDENGKLTDLDVQTFDACMKPLITYFYNESGKLEEKEVNTYDDNGLLIESRSVSGDNNTLSRMTVEYDKNKQTKTETNYSGVDTLLSKSIYQLNEEENTIEVTQYDKTGEVEGYKLDKFGKGRKIHFYDDYNEPLMPDARESRDKNKNNTNSSQYKPMKPDKNNNPQWIVVYDNGLPTIINEREIKYHK